MLAGRVRGVGGGRRAGAPGPRRERKEKSGPLGLVGRLSAHWLTRRSLCGVRARTHARALGAPLTQHTRTRTQTISLSRYGGRGRPAEGCVRGSASFSLSHRSLSTSTSSPSVHPFSRPAVRTPSPPTPRTATIAKLAKDILARSTTSDSSPPPRLSQEAVAATAACASEFVRLLAGEAAEAATKAGKNTIVVRERRERERERERWAGRACAARRCKTRQPFLSILHLSSLFSFSFHSPTTS